MNAEKDQPAGFPGYDQTWLPAAAEAAERVLVFVSWFGDGRVNEADDDGRWGPQAPLFARDLEAVAKAAKEAPVCGHGLAVGSDVTSDPGECQICDWCPQCEGVRIHLNETCVACGRRWGAA